MEVSERLVGSPAFKAGGMGDPCPAGSIPVHLRHPWPAAHHNGRGVVIAYHRRPMTDASLPELPTLFDGEPQHHVFPYLHEFLPSVRMEAAPTPYVFPVGEPLDFPETHKHEGVRSTAEFLIDTDTVALLVVQHGELRHEQYWLTGGRDVQWISWSVAKSFVSTLIGIAIADGHIGGIDEIISDYATALRGSAYDGVSIEDVLQMSSGARWYEDYSDPSSDVHGLVRTMTGEITLEEFVAGIPREHPPASLCRYNSADTQALGLLLRAATGRTIADYMHEKLSVPLGMEAPGYWLTDHEHVEMAYGGLMLAPHDFAKLGELFRRGGDWFGTQIVPADWVAASTTYDKPHTQPGAPEIGGMSLPDGYGYQWWLNPGSRRAYEAVGIYNQYVHIDPPSSSVIVKLSANRRYGTDNTQAASRDIETARFFNAVIDAL